MTLVGSWCSRSRAGAGSWHQQAKWSSSFIQRCLQSRIKVKQQPCLLFFKRSVALKLGQGEGGRELEEIPEGKKCFWEQLCLGSEKSFIRPYFETTDINSSSSACEATLFFLKEEACAPGTLHTGPALCQALAGVSILRSNPMVLPLPAWKAGLSGYVWFW